MTRIERLRDGQCNPHADSLEEMMGDISARPAAGVYAAAADKFAAANPPVRLVRAQASAIPSAAAGSESPPRVVTSGADIWLSS